MSSRASRASPGADSSSSAKATAGEAGGQAARVGGRQRGKSRSTKRTRVHTSLEVPKSNFVGFVTTFEYEVFAVVWQRVLDALMKEG
jgi:hypothetical protein